MVEAEKHGLQHTGVADLFKHVLLLRVILSELRDQSKHKQNVERKRKEGKEKREKRIIWFPRC